MKRSSLLPTRTDLVVYTPGPQLRLPIELMEMALERRWVVRWNLDGMEREIPEAALRDALAGARMVAEWSTDRVTSRPPAVMGVILWSQAKALHPAREP